MKKIFRIAYWELDGSFSHIDDNRYLIGLDGNLYEVYNNTTSYIPCDMTQKYIIEQYTGENDKNGKPIFEGDIIKYDYPSDKDVLINSSRECRNTVHVRCTEPDHDNHPGIIMCDLYCQSGPCEVVGNIHQNSDLLK